MDRPYTPRNGNSLHTSNLLNTLALHAISSVAKQRQRNKQFDNSRYQVTARKQQQNNGVLSADRKEMLAAGQLVVMRIEF
jgi:hypothetical protein